MRTRRIGAISALPADGIIEKVGIGVIDHAAKRLSALAHADGNAAVSESADKIRRAVDRVDDKGQGVRESAVFLFLCEKEGIRKGFPELFEQELLHGDIVGRDEVCVPALLRNSPVGTIDGAQKVSRLQKKRERGIQYFLRECDFFFFHGFLIGAGSRSFEHVRDPLTGKAVAVRV